MTIRYLNTDLDLSSAEDLTELATALEAKGLFILHSARCDDRHWLAIFENHLPTRISAANASLKITLYPWDGFQNSMS